MVAAAPRVANCCNASTFFHNYVPSALRTLHDARCTRPSSRSSEHVPRSNTQSYTCGPGMVTCAGACPHPDHKSRRSLRSSRRVDFLSAY